MSGTSAGEVSLGQVLSGVLEPSQLPQEWSQIGVSDLTVDSRRVKKNACFIAYPGHHSDGRRFIENAVEAGAGSVIAEKKGLEMASPSKVALVAIENLNTFLPRLANNFFEAPSSQLALFAVTGTNGKTSISQMVAAAVTEMKQVAGVIGTLGNGLFGQLQETRNTTPDVIETNRLLRSMLSRGADIVAMEMSSHGLVQGRCDGLNIHTALISNISRDHLDYHHTMEAYRDAKALLAENPTIKNLILNADDPLVISLGERAQPGVNLLSFSLAMNEAADICTKKVAYQRHGIELEVVYRGQSATICSSLIGDFNGSNLLAATAALIALGFDLTAACEALSKIEAIAGRMQRVGHHNELPTVVVDFAHTPDALEKVLSALRRHCKGALWCVFGCGGDRDSGKRPLMAKIASELADEIVITADNPRSEKFSDVVAQMAKGIPHGKSFQIIEAREEAVAYAITNARIDDVVLLAGKGHENYQEIAGEKRSYSDLISARRALALRHQRGAQPC